MTKRNMIFLAIISCILWASAFPTLKILYSLLQLGSDVGVKILLAGIRFFFAGTAILLFFMIRYKALPQCNFIWKTFFLGLLQTTFMYAFFYIGLYNSTGVKSSIISQTSIFLIVVLSHFVYRDDKMHRGKWIGLLLGFLGIVVVNINGLFSADNFFNFKFNGEGFLIISGFFATASTFLAKALGKKINPIILTGWQMTFGGAILIIWGFITKNQSLEFNSILSVSLLIYSIIISAGAFTLWFILLQKNKASELSILKFSIPVFGAILSAIFIPGETITIFIILSLILVSTGIYLCNKISTKNPRE